MSLAERTHRHRAGVRAAVITTVLTTTLLTSMLTTTAARASGPPLPNSMASAGDSITRAYDINWRHLFSDAPGYSWTTGSSSRVSSHYRRILAANPAIAHQVWNDAATGSKVAALAGQVRRAADQGADYLTILVGANDVCTPSIDTMTPAATFEEQFRTALEEFTAADPQARVLVASIPNVYQLWSILHDDPIAEFTWEIFDICQSMLSITNTSEERSQVLARVQEDNAALESVCAQFSQCRWDGGTAFAYPFTEDQVSTVDYFHPNLAGQNALAQNLWTAGYWPDV